MPYDAAQTLEALGARLRDEVELDVLRAELLGVAKQMVAPSAYVSVVAGEGGRIVNRATSAGRVPTRRVASALAWSLLVLTLLVMIAGSLLERTAGSLDANLAEYLALMTAFMSFPVVGALIASRHPRNAIGWMLIGVGLLVASLVLGTAYARYGLVLHPERDLPFTTLGAWLESWAWTPLISIIPTLLFLLFPTGRPPSRRWVPVAWLAGGFVALVTVLSMLEEKLVSHGYSIANPIGIDGLGNVEDMGLLLDALIPLAFLCTSSLFFRYRAAGSRERQQLKWVAVAAAFFAAGSMAGDALELPGFLFPLFLGAIPVSVGIAILRHRLYDVDVIINRTLVYSVLTALLLGSYLVIVVALGRILDPVTRDSDIAVAASTLAVAALFGPLRRRVQAFIDRRFYRRKYDASRALNDFGSRLRDEIELDTVRSDVLGVIGETLQPAHASLWINRWEAP